MARFIGRAIVYKQAAGQGTTFTFPVPPGHQAGDEIYFVVQNNSAAGGAITCSGTYAAPSGAPTTTISGVSRVQAFQKIASSSSEANITLTGQDQDWIVVIVIVRDVDQTTPVDIFGHNDFTTNVASQTVNGVTTPTNNSVVLSIPLIRSAGKQLPAIANMDDFVPLEKDSNNTALNVLAGYRVQRTAGATPSLGTINNIASTSTGRAMVAAFRDVNPSDPTLPPEFSANYRVIKLLMGTTGAGTPTDSFSRNETTVFNDGNTVAATSIGGRAIIAATPTVAQTAFTDNDVESIWGASTAISISVSAIDAAGRWVGVCHNVTEDLSGGIFSLTFGMNSLTTGNIGAEGCLVYFEDSSGEWAAFQLSKRDGMQPTVPYNTQIALDSATPYDESGAIDWTDIVKIGYYYHRVTTNTLTRGMFIRLAAFTTEPIAFGGSEAAPVNAGFISNIMQGWANFRQAPAQTAEQLYAKTSITFGNGSDKTVVDLSGNSIVQPSLPDGSFDGQFWQGASQVLTTKFNTSTDDIIILDGATISSPQEGVNQILDFSAGSAPASFSTRGAVIRGQVVTGGAGRPFNRATFENCGLITLNGSEINNSTVTNSTSDPAVITDVPELISNTAFTSPGTGHAIEFEAGAAGGTFNFYGNTFSGYGADGTDDAALYNNSGGTVTLVLENAGDPIPTVKDEAGSTTVIQQPSVDIEVNYAAGSTVQIYNIDTTTEIYAGTPSGTQYNFTVDGEASDGDNILVKVTKLGKSRWFSIQPFSDTAGAIFTASQPDDLNYTTYGIDGSTVTTVDWDSGDQYITIDEIGTTWSMQKVYAWHNYYITTLTGIREAFDALTPIDIANIIISDDVLLDNLTSINLKQSDNIRLYNSTGDQPMAQPTTGGYGFGFFSTGYIYQVNVEGSPVITGNIADAIAAIDALNNLSSADVTAAVPSAAANATAVEAQLADEFNAIPTAAENAAATASELSSGLGEILSNTDATQAKVDQL